MEIKHITVTLAIARIYAQKGELYYRATPSEKNEKPDWQKVETNEINKTLDLVQAKAGEFGVILKEQA